MQDGKHVALSAIIEPGRLYSADEVGKVFGLSKTTLSNWRSLGRGPEYIKFGGAVRYTGSGLIDHAARSAATK